MYAVGRALREVPALNAGWDAKTMAAKSFDGVDVCVAVATEDGLITPIVTGADVKSLTAIGADVKALAKKAREGALKPHEFMGGSFSVSNLGMFGVESFSAIINPPQGAILAVGAGVDKVVLVDGAPATKKVMTVRVSTDRRVVDEGDSARWLTAFADQFRKTDQWAIT
jgi:pyruvate/2-oxoglutarate dehydrogenase complex dihydrolipoamide acyltransferase (E2) component